MPMQQSIIIQRPAENIFTYLSESEHLVDWSSSAGMLKLPEAVVENIVKRQLQHDLLTLKDVVEGGAV